MIDMPHPGGYVRQWRNRPAKEGYPLERNAPPSVRAQAASRPAAARLRAGRALLVLSVGLLMAGVAPVTGAAQAPQPDPAPTPPSVSPDPAPGTEPPTGTAPPASTPPAPAPPAPAPPAPTQSAPPVAPDQPTAPEEVEPAPAPSSSRAETRAKARRAAATKRRAERAARRAAARRRAQRRRRIEAAVDDAAFVRLGSLLPARDRSDERDKHLVLLGAGALLALVVASGSFATMASRTLRGQLG
jgi:type IV secretory pathway VirB10-like protein